MAPPTRSVTFEPMVPPEPMTLSGVRILYEPSVFGGDGSETRKNMVFVVPPSIVARVQGLEAPIDPARLCSCIKGDALKCKVNMDRVRIFDSGNAPSPQPGIWRDLIVNALVTVRGTWSTRTQSGLSIEVHDIQLLDDKPPECPFPVLLSDVRCIPSCA